MSISSSMKQKYHERIVSDSSTIQEVQQIVSKHPDIIHHTYCHAIPLDRLCMKRTSNVDKIIYLIERGMMQEQKHNNVRSNGNGRKHSTLRACKGGLLRDKGICMPPLKMLIFNDRVDVLDRLKDLSLSSTIDNDVKGAYCNYDDDKDNDEKKSNDFHHSHYSGRTKQQQRQHKHTVPLIQPKDIQTFQFLHFAVEHCRLEWVQYFLEIYPQGVHMKDSNDMLPIHVCANEWHRHPDLFWGVFRLLLDVGVKQNVGGRNGFGGLFVPTPKTNQSILYDIFKSVGVTWEKISQVVQEDIHVRNVLIRQLALGCIPKDHFDDIITYFKDCLYVKDEKDGRLPIHVAAEYGLKWEDGMKEIVEANVLGLAYVDEVTGLYPFALAAATTTTTTSPTSGNDNDVVNDNADGDVEEKELQCIFELLRSFPDCCKIEK